MATVVISPFDVATFPAGGGHFWVYAQYAQGLMRLGCEVIWLERIPQELPETATATFFDRMERCGLGGNAFLYRDESEVPEAIAHRADLLLNFDQRIDPALLARFRRTALVDIDPGLLQFWMATGQLEIAPHDVHFTIGETVGTAAARFPDGGRDWVYTPPPVCLEEWPYSYDPGCEAFTTVSTWWGGNGKGEWVTDGNSLLFENNKRVSFLQFIELPLVTAQSLELALALGDGDLEHGDGSPSGRQHLPESTDYISDEDDRRALERHGWRLRDAQDVARSPQLYADYIRASRGEFSCVKPSCVRFENAWISDRTLCYLASGKPVVVQDTGPSSFLPDGEGMFRFSSLEEAAEAIARVNEDYERQCRAAREIAEDHFDSKRVLAGILDAAL
ncbi:MAG TPA: glycosyltransferase [Solirubrobacterales bacterium]